MRRLATAVVLCALGMSFAGCTVNIGVPDATTEKTVSPPPVTAESPAEASAEPEATGESTFLEFMRREAPMTYTETTERELVSGGYTVCTFFRDGATGREVAEAMAASAQATGGDTTESIVLIYGAVTHLCPEYTETMSNLG